jgi:Ni,Fe-hydrogenase III large subunit
MLDAGFNFGGSHGARLREMIMRIHERLTGSRFLRGVNAIGGVKCDIDDKESGPLARELTRILEDFLEIIAAAENSPSLLNRLKGTGKLSQQCARDHGMVGIAARSVGLSIDARVDFPYAAYGDLGFGMVAAHAGGDVYARFSVREQEVRSSVKIIIKALLSLPPGPILSSPAVYSFPKNAFTVGIVEGWRGDIVYFITTDESGRIDRVAPRDPSFVNWSAVEYAAPGNIVPDFPLINKSFNLSYSGNDL